MVNNKTKISFDSVYLLKLIIFFILGCLWLSFDKLSYPLPIGFVFGLMLSSHDHFKIDRRVEYAILLIALILSYIEPIGFVLSI